MKSSIRIKLAVLLLVFVSGTFLVYFAINTVFLEGYYRNEKRQDLVNLYTSISQFFDENTEVDVSSRNYMTRLCESYGVSLLVTDAAGVEKFNYGANEILAARLQEIIFLGKSNDVSVLEENEKYVIQTTTEKISGSSYLEMWGILGQQRYFIVRMSYDSVQESVDISNKFFSYVGLMLIFIDYVIMLSISRHFTKPILELSGIARRMSNLEFGIRYKGQEDDELGALGSSINQLSEKLEKTISELKTANNELKRDLEKKSEMDEIRKEFLSNVSHELKTPIALIQGYAEGLKESVNEDEGSRDFYCDVIMDEAVKMNNIVKKLLALNQIESGKNLLYMERFDVVSLICGSLNNSSILIKQKNVTVYFDDRKPVYVWSDEFLTEQVIANYLSNALHHVEGEMVIRIDVEQLEKVVRVSVYNTGKNIPQEDIGKIWDKFYKVDKARTREYGGSGIGLSIVKAVQDSLNKGYGVENVRDGVVFWFELDAES
ncbi:sensor histidine kinase [Parasporobacterium paucivorans]|uniref:histidine kinase n=1 Tax=Parasporobacterium paucivorans DSM 15970 TaxID=1122934 RepID=A0A1M6EV89_9FIRM|nr:HAMP domain-containing sensor histidine kinase [Parasporobacterium paucivorans]SHI89280.1 Signal transduction histidine kinase [Parasporobacterium paucivorans DSM 15970]